MNKRLLVDTNILIYAIDADSIFHENALELLFNSGYELYTTSKNISEFLGVLTKNSSVKTDISELLKILKDLIANFIVLYPNKDTNFKFEELLKKYKPRGLIIHDFEIISIALASNINQIASQNADDFKKVNEISLIHL